jgi:polysaccharide pyruvyl transferase WcaK-like protein
VSARIGPARGPIIDDLRRIAIWGHYHGRNLGDEMVVSTLVSAIRRRRPEAEILGISMTPGDTESRHGLRAYPINPGMPTTRPRWSAVQPEQTSSRGRQTVARIPGARPLYHALTAARLAAREVAFAPPSYHFVRGLDAVVVAGSGQLIDVWHPLQHPYTTFRWALLSRLARVHFAFVSVGAGPIRSHLSAFFVRKAIELASYVSVRDDYSVEMLRALGLPGPFIRCPDMAYAYPGLDDGRRSAAARGESAQPIVGFQVMAYKHPTLWPGGDAELYGHYFEKMVSFARWLLKQGCTVRVFSSQVASDNVVSQDLLAAVGEPLTPGRLEFPGADLESVDDLVETIAGCDVIVTARFHAALVPLALGIPVLALAYDRKTTELFADYDLSDWCVDIDGFAVEELERLFDRARKEGLPEAVGERVAANRVAVEAQFDELFGPEP